MGMDVSASRSGATCVAVGDELFADQIFRRGVHGLDRRDGAVAQMEDGEFARRRDRRAATSLVGRPRQTRDLQLEIVLVRPEPGHFAIGASACRASPSAACLAWSMAFCTHSRRSAMPSRPMMPGAVAGGEDRGIAGARRSRRRRCRPRSAGRPRAPSSIVGNDADADQHEIGGIGLAAGAHALKPVPLPSKASTPVLRSSLTPAGAMNARRRNPRSAAKPRAPSAGPSLRTRSRRVPRLAATAATSRPI